MLTLISLGRLVIVRTLICNYSFHCYRREILKERAPHLVQSVCAYRAGYTAEVYEMPSIEEKLKMHSLTCPKVNIFLGWNTNGAG